MPSTDIDGSPIMILSEDEAKTIHRFLMCFFGRGYLIQDEIEVGNKIAKTFGLEPVGPSRDVNCVTGGNYAS